MSRLLKVVPGYIMKIITSTRGTTLPVIWLLLIGTTLETKSNDTAATRENIKIIGGMPASPGEFPYIVTVESSLDRRLFCGGIILTKRTVLTSAYCLASKDLNRIQIVAGEHDRSNFEATEQIRQLKAITFHPAYESLNFKNNLAVVELSKDFSFNQHVRNIQIPDNEFDYHACQNAEIAGWGVAEEGSSEPNSILLKSTIPLVSMTECLKLYENETQAVDGHFMLCAGQEGKDSCVGDSGGPLTCIVGQESYVIGTTSHGAGCGRKNFPGIYMRLRAYKTWLSDISKSSRVMFLHHALICFAIILHRLLQ